MFKAQAQLEPISFVSDSMTYVIVDGDTLSYPFSCSTCPVIINDAAGNQITMYANGNVSWGSYLETTGEFLDVVASETGTFIAPETQHGGFDAKDYKPFITKISINQFNITGVK